MDDCHFVPSIHSTQFVFCLLALQLMVRSIILNATCLTSAKSGTGIVSILSILKGFESEVRIWSILSGPVIRIILSDIASTI